VFADRARLRPVAVFDETLYPEDDEPSQFDLDVHAIFELPGTDLVVVTNHLGFVRLFRRGDLRADGRRHRVRPARRLELLDDLERVVPAGDRLVASRPREQRLDGVLVTQPVPGAAGRLDATVELDDFGTVTALAAHTTPSGDGWLALGGEGRVRLTALEAGSPTRTQWEAEVDFLPSVLLADGSTVWAAGSARGGTGVDDYDWEQLRGGGFVALDVEHGRARVRARFGGDLAWGSGGVPFAVVAGRPIGVGRRGELHALPPGAEETVVAVPALFEAPLGIAHAAAIGDRLLAGFNRGGYRLQLYAAETVQALPVPPLASGP
jgi:hypothetical protein